MDVRQDINSAQDDVWRHARSPRSCSSGQARGKNHTVGSDLNSECVPQALACHMNEGLMHCPGVEIGPGDAAIERGAQIVLDPGALSACRNPDRHIRANHDPQFTAPTGLIRSRPRRKASNSATRNSIVGSMKNTRPQTGTPCRGDRCPHRRRLSSGRYSRRPVARDRLGDGRQAAPENGLGQRACLQCPCRRNTGNRRTEYQPITGHRRVSQPHVFFWVQHLLGIGHLQRTATLARAFRRAGMTVTVVSGALTLPPE